MDDLELSNAPDNSQVIEAMKNAMQQKGKEYKESELYKDPNWIEASALVYKMKEGKEFNGDVNELAKYGIDKMSEFNYNVSFGMVPDVLDVEDADHDTQVAFAYMMDTYDKKDVTIEGFGRAVKELALDPTSYVGIGTLGAGFAVKKSAQEVAKQGLKNRLMAKISSYLTNEVAIGATEGALYTAGDEVARESVYQDAGMMDGYSPENIAIAGGLGAVAGGGIVKGVKMVGKGIDIANKAGEEAMAISAGGGTPSRGIGEIWGNGFSSRIAKKVPINQLNSDVKRGEFKDRMQFYNPVKLTNGDRISGFNEIGSDVLYGYDKNNELFTIDAEKLSKNFTIDMEQKQNNAPAQETAKILEEYLRKFKKETK